MPLFSSYRRSRQPEQSGQPSSQPVQASSTSSIYIQQPEPILPVENEISTSAEVTMTWNTDALHEGQHLTIRGQGREDAVVVSLLVKFCRALMTRNFWISMRMLWRSHPRPSNHHLSKNKSWNLYHLCLDLSLCSFSYDVARIPSYPVVYTFSSLGATSSAMILVPTQDSPDSRPVYHISIGNDPFLPMCFITSVVRGGYAEGEYVGGFKCVLTFIRIYYDHDILDI